MSGGPLQGLRLLVVEDEYFIAVEVCDILIANGAEVLGPVGSVDEGAAVAEREPLDGAVLDVNLHGAMVYALVDQLTAAGTPMLFVTGYDPGALPADRRDAVILGKPVDRRRLVEAAAACFAKST